MSGRGLATIGGVVLVLAASVAVPALRGLTADDALSVPVYRVERADFIRTVWAEGVLEATEATVLGPPAEITRPLRIAWLAPDGSRVSEGDVVVRFDPTEMERELQEGRFDKAITESQIDQREKRDEGNLRNFERDAEMAGHELTHAESLETRDERIFSRTEIIESEIDRDLAGSRKSHAEAAGAIHRDLSRAELDLLAIERRKAELKIEQAATGLEGLEVRAPHDGILVLKRRWGRVPEVGEMAWGGRAVAELPRLEKMQAKVFVLEVDAGGLVVDLVGKLHLDAHLDRSYDVRVSQVDALAERRNQETPVQYFGVTLELERTDASVMKLGQRVQAKIVLEESANVITVPRQAVFDEEDKHVVHVRRAGGWRPVEVTLGARGLGRVVIESGLEEGDRIALRDPDEPIESEDGESSSADSSPLGSAS